MYLGDLRGRVAHHGDDGVVAAHALLLAPRLHHRRVVDAEDDNLVDPFGLEKLSFLKVPRDLDCRSRGCECAREADEDDLLSAEVLRQLAGSEAEAALHARAVEGEPRRERIAHNETHTRFLGSCICLGRAKARM